MSIQYLVIGFVLVFFVSLFCYKKTEVESILCFMVIFLLIAFIALGMGIAIAAYWDSRPARMACLFVLLAGVMIKIVTTIHSRPTAKKNIEPLQTNEHI
ncbi:MAG: hypothetical protein UT48_C0010G0005 [Parcubacteria group bacterium GW2011_GWE2_39_37]|uniref:Uncharacterized protein n=1 Tax=Candidatus Falkowbacteria bacterium GW2011_GWF2_39_8 TaxID=1618642 RepID=A0A0G0PSC5_9BACT|nr:MAG: hypothetical protein UT48_C0010G0005 [Parcubacteria group bacterium GW2011_GWE2_39_37]KKR31059.1 MAG: hypothetical protein UT64_C0076G0003 [Candidatus Falkowbacteria bacterium GW2011_GWF2_39_8]